MSKYPVIPACLSLIALISVAKAGTKCGAGPLGLTYCGMKWEDYFDGRDDSQLGRTNQCKNGCGGSSYGGDSTRTGNNYGGGINTNWQGYGGGQSGGDPTAQSGNGFESSSSGFSAQGGGYSGNIGSDGASNGNTLLYVNGVEVSSNVIPTSNMALDQRNGYVYSTGLSTNRQAYGGGPSGGDQYSAQSGNGFEASSSGFSVQGRGYSGNIGSDGASNGNTLYVNGVEVSSNVIPSVNVVSDQGNGYVYSTGFNTDGQSSSFGEGSNGNAINANGFDFRQGASTNYNSLLSQGGVVEQTSGSFSSGSQGSSYDGSSNAGSWVSEVNSRPCTTCGGSRTTNVGNGKNNDNKIYF